jgi:hypothetical protein
VLADDGARIVLRLQLIIKLALLQLLRHQKLVFRVQTPLQQLLLSDAARFLLLPPCRVYSFHECLSL